MKRNRGNRRNSKSASNATAYKSCFVSRSSIKTMILKIYKYLLMIFIY